ncbi:hypothetical protein LOK49_LG02G00911 [Camellia lanceoleosa]|uniref:Uncharacterized protein n=1 Tax=Camellia lanceoleosa TaxID=1840588 RepID=A0ACC0IJG7_9ERIC|nr:hypothetical protein LOK49_LG02G00911 [Camellia lanceoleosa]
MSNGSSMYWVIKMVMKMDAAEPFNVPVDPVALAIPTSKSKALVDSKSKSSRKHDGGGGEKIESSGGLVGEKVESKSSSKVKDSKSKSKDYNIELENQSGETVQLGSETDQRAVMMGLMLHANAKQLIKMERYKDALEVLPMGELTGIEFCWFAKDLAVEALCRNKNDTQKALDDLTNPESNSAIQREGGGGAVFEGDNGSSCGGGAVVEKVGGDEGRARDEVAQGFANAPELGERFDWVTIENVEDDVHGEIEIVVQRR